MKRLALAAVAALAFAVLAAPAVSENTTHHHTPPEARCLLPHFEVFAAQVWAPKRWHRGAPPASTIAAAHRRIGCAPTASHRHAMKAIWRADRRAFYARRHYCQGGPVYEGRVSYFSGGLTAGGYQATEPGIALYESSTLGQVFRVTTGGHTALLRHIDVGPAPWTGRTIDITEASFSALGGAVTTDSWGRAQMIPGGCL